MYQIGSEEYNSRIRQYKIRKEDDYFIVYFPELGSYFATNETGVDILSFFYQNKCDNFFAYFTEIYGQLDKDQEYEVFSFIKSLCKLNIIERVKKDEKI
ncbi:MAG: hypothetical protein HFF38_13005 [Lawsonibacter sp.]|nr:hypothetical protein [Lawsonibacter sp.]